MARIKRIKAEDGKRLGIEDCPNIDVSGSVTGMKKRFWGEDALVVRCGGYYYNVTRRPLVYDQAK